MGPPALAKQVAEDLEIVSQLPTDNTEIETLTADASALAHVLESVAREGVRPELASALDCCPIDHHYAPTVRDLIAALSWAVDNAADLHAVGIADVERRRAVGRDRLEHLSEASGMTPAEVAAAIEVDPPIVEGWLRGEWITSKHRRALCELFRVKEPFLMGEA